MQQHTWNELTVQLWPKCIRYQGRIPAYETAIPSKWCSLILAFLDRATMPLIWFQSSHISGMGTVLVKCKPSRIFNSTKKSGQYQLPLPPATQEIKWQCYATQERSPTSTNPGHRNHKHPAGWQIPGSIHIPVLIIRCSITQNSLKTCCTIGKGPRERNSTARFPNCTLTGILLGGDAPTTGQSEGCWEPWGCLVLESLHRGTKWLQSLSEAGLRPAGLDLQFHLWT